MIYRVKNCKVVGADPSLNTKNGLLFSINDGRSRIINELPIGEKVTDIDGRGGLLLPAFTDIGCHYYDPKNESRDSLITASASASAGGYRRLITLDEESCVLNDGRIIAAKSVKNCIDGGGIYFGRYGDIPSDRLLSTFNAIKENGGLYISAGIDENMAIGSFACGSASKMTGTSGITRFDECAELGRELFAAYESGCALHVMAIGCREAIEMIKAAKKSGVAVTCGVSPFHLSLCENDVAFYGAMCKLLPPLRSRSDREALKEGVLDGSIDCICSLHTPHSKAERGTSVKDAPYGLCSFETALPVVLTYLPELLGRDSQRLAELFSVAPSRIIGENYTLSEGKQADFVIIDPSRELVISENTLKSKSCNTPFLGQTLNGCYPRLFIDGRE